MVQHDKAHWRSHGACAFFSQVHRPGVIAGTLRALPRPHARAAQGWAAVYVAACLEQVLHVSACLVRCYEGAQPGTADCDNAASAEAASAEARRVRTARSLAKYVPPLYLWHSQERRQMSAMLHGRWVLTYLWRTRRAELSRYVGRAFVVAELTEM